jgi:multiple sugar transport system permease protein
MKRSLLYIVAVGLAAVFLIPLLWTVSTALKTRQQVYSTPTQWIPTSYLAADRAGVLQPVTIVTRLNSPAAQVQLLSGPQSGQIIAVEQSGLRQQNGQLVVQLRAPDPVAVKLLQSFPDGVAEVRFAGSTVNVFFAPSQLHAQFAPQWRNFAAAWNLLPLPFHWFLLNTYAITAVNVLGQTLSCSLVAYGFARFRFRGRTPLFLLLLSTMMLPPQVTMIPQYLLWKKLHALDSFTPLMAPAFFASSAFYVFLLRQFYLSLPRELDEAAMLDGCGPFRIWWQILVPLSRPALITVAVLCFIGSWDDFLGPLIYINRLDNYTVSLALRLFQDQYGTDFSLLMAAALVHVVPVMVLFFIAQRYFVKGIAMTGLKG